MLRWNKSKKGFTLVELVIVIAILGILALYALPKYQGIVEQARSSEAKAQLGSFRSALGIYYAKNHGVYPDYDTVNAGKIFANDQVPDVEITDDDGNVVKSAAIKKGDGDGDATNDVDTSGGGGWVYDDGSTVTPKYSKADVRLNSTDIDPATANDNTPMKWYQY